MIREADRAPVAGVILAGGRSTRMGQDKAGLLYRGIPLLDHARHLLNAAGCSAVLVSGRPDLPDGIADTHPGEGPAHGVLDALDAASRDCTGIIVIPVDMPLLEPVDLVPLIGGDRATCRVWTEHPLPAFIPCGLARPRRTDVHSIRGLLSFWPTHRVDAGAGRLDRFRNINTPGDLAALMS